MHIFILLRQQVQRNLNYLNSLVPGLVRIIESSDNENGQSWLAVIHIAYGNKLNISFNKGRDELVRDGP